MDRWAETLGWVLVHSVWQGAALALALALALRLVPRAMARGRYAAACATLVGMLVLPTVTGLRARHASVAPADRPRAARHDASPTVAAPGTVTPPASPTALARVLTRVRPTHVRVPRTRDEMAGVLRPLLPALAMAWLLGALLVAARLAGGLVVNRALVRTDVFAPPAEWGALLDRLRRAMHVRRPVRLLASARIAAPMLVGWWRPIVLLPAAALTGLAPWQIELLMRHELAHVRRYDYLVNLLQRVAEVLLFHHPAAWWVGRQIRTEREHCCDDIVAAAAGVRRYVHALVAMEELRAHGLPPSAPLALGADGGSLLHRVQRLTGAQAGVARPHPGWARASRTSIALGALLAAGILVTAVVTGPPWSARGRRDALGARAAASVVPAPTPSLHATCAAEAARAQTTLCTPLTAYVSDLLRRRGDVGAVVVQEVATGAMVSYTAASRGDEPRVTDTMDPASIWKLSFAAIWWEQGLGERMVPCPARLAVGGRVLAHWGAPRPPMTAAEMLVTSCNTAAAAMALELRDRLGPQGMRDAFRRLGFPVAAPASGEDRTRDHAFWAGATPVWRARMSPRPAVLHLPSDDDAAGWAALAVGDGVALSPLHVARFLQAIGHDGRMRRPTVARTIAAQSDTGVRVMAPATARRLRVAMREVVRDGTAQAAAPLLRGARWSLGGKTGTRTVPGMGRDTARVDGWFAGLLLDDAQVARYAVVVYIRGKGSGGGAAASIAAELTRVIGGSA